MLSSVSILLLDFVPNLFEHKVFLIKRRASQVIEQSLQLIGLYGTPKFYQSLVMVGAVVVVQILKIYYYPLVLERPSFYWIDLGPERPKTLLCIYVQGPELKTKRRNASFGLDVFCNCLCKS